MAINDVLGLTVELEANTAKFVKDLRKATKEVGNELTFNPKYLIKQFGRAQNGIQKILSSTVADAASAGFSKSSIISLTRKLSSVTDQIAASNKRIFELSIEMGRKGIDAQEKERLKGLRKEAQERLKMQEELFKQEKASTDRIMGRRKKAMVEAARLAEKEHMKGLTKLGKAGEWFGEGISSAFSKIKSGDVGGLLKGIGGGTSKMGKEALGKVQKGEGGGLLKSIGGLLSKIGPAISAIGALAAGLGSLVAIAISADSAIKGLNKSLLDSGMAGVELANQYNVLGTTLTDISQHFAESFSLKNTWGTTAKDHMEILGAFASAGVTFKQMKESVHEVGTEMDRLQKYTEVALTYSKLLGMSTQEISTQMASYMEELGYTLEGIQARFSNITVATKESGFATKRFLNMLFQATSGMSMYNVRLEEAAGLLINLGKILGQKMGGDFLQQLMKGFKDEGTQDRIKKTMTTGVGYSLKVLKQDAIQASEEFRQKMDELGKSNAGAQAAVQKALSDMGVTATDPEGMVKQLSKLTTAQQAQMLAKAEASRNPAMVRMLTDLMNKSAAFKGGLAGAQAARASAGGNAALLLQLNEIRALTGGGLQDISKLDMTKRMAAEAATGKSGEEFEKLYRIGQRFSGRQAEIKERQAEIRKARKEGRFGDAQDLADKFNKEFGEQFGVVLDEMGNRIRLQRDVNGKAELDPTLYEGPKKILEDTFEALVMAQGGDLQGKEQARIAEDIMLAQEIAENTTDMAKVLEQGVEYFLSKIYRAVQHIASFFGHGLDEEESDAKSAASQAIQDSLNETRDQIRLQQQAISRQQRALKLGRLKGADKEKAEQDVKDRQAEIKRLKGKFNIERQQLRAVERITDSDEVEGFGDSKAAGSYLAAGAKDKQVREQTKKELLAQGVDVEAEAQAKADAHRQRELAKIEEKRKLVDEAATYGFGMGMGGARVGASVSLAMRKSNVEDDVKEITDQVYASRAEEVFGVAGGVQAQDRWGIDKDPTQFKGKTLPELMKGMFIDTSRKEAELSKGEMDEEAKQKEEQTKELVEGFRKITKEEKYDELAILLSQTGVGGSAASLHAMAKRLMDTGSTRGIPMNEMVPDPVTGQMRRRGDILRGKAGASGAAAIQKDIGAPQAPVPLETAGGGDFAAIYSASRGRFTARVAFNSRDDLAMQGRKSGGPLDQARGGKGGTTVVVNSFGNSAEIVRGIQAAVAAGVV